MNDFVNRYPNLASAGLGAEVTFATDDFFADKARLISDETPVWVPDLYDDHGKWMDGWESRRKRGPGHDHCLIRLAGVGSLTGLVIDTRHFTGNYPPAASVDGCLSDGQPGPDATWRTILPTSELGPDAPHYFPLEGGAPVNWLRLNIYPDGGVARLRAHGVFHHDWSAEAGQADVELSSLLKGGRIVGYNNAHYGNPYALIGAGRGKTMGDGWETRRRRDPGYDWIIVALGHPGTIDRIEVDTAHFKGNFPESCSVQAALCPDLPDKAIITNAMFWDDVLTRQPLSADSIHTYGGDQLASLGPVSHVRLSIFPDGGVSRLRIFGSPA